MKKAIFICCLISIGYIQTIMAQISPPGLGKAHTAGWLAIGVRQDLDTIPDKGWQSMTYLGVGRISNPDNYDPVQKPALFVINQEFYHQLPKNWQYSLAVSYRRQHEYEDEFPFIHENPEISHEFRMYGRLFYNLKSSWIKLTPAFRQEFRKYFSSTTNSTENFQLRSRFKLQLAVNLDKKKQHRLTLSSEQLFAISKDKNPALWTDFSYKESRFAVYYSFAPENLPLIFNGGYMYNIVGKTYPYDVHYLAFDIIIENPYQLFRHN